ncbi:MAG: Nif3-like dinuclear metal center hexameric protein [Enterococcaceae bacterium]|jgi:dinuclear metal center YbgI/SA1388 family protein|nr:Nif3-like dinuclear metal center hexameric protein [Enterococcaceae bacterium]
MIEARTFIEQLNLFCPPYLGEEGDPNGLHLGTLDKKIGRVMMTLDVRPEVVAEAIEKKVDLLIAKHPPIFRPIERLTTNDPQIKMYADLLKHDIAVFACHTNMDIMEPGLNDWLAEKLGVQVDDFLAETHRFPYQKLAVFVPAPNADHIREVLQQAGAGRLGDYTGASFSAEGTGRFRPEKGAHPAIGKIGKLEEVIEEKVEVVFPKTLASEIVEAMLAAHPYEEPAYDLYDLSAPEKVYGIGRVGMLKKALPLERFVAQVKEAFRLDGLRLIAEDPQKMIQRVAICGGSGGKLYPEAVLKGADVYITGDVYYHTGHDMLAHHLPVIDPGHYIEELCKEKFVEEFEKWKQKYAWDCEFMISETNTNPFRFY